MAFNGSGVYTAPSNSFAQAVTGTTIDSANWNATRADLETALSNVICKDGQTTVTANLPMATYRHTGVSNATALTQYATADQVVDSSLIYCGASAAGSDTYAVSAAVSPGAYVTGSKFRFQADVANTGACTLNISGIGAASIKTLDGGDPSTGAIAANQFVEVIYDGTNFVLQNNYKIDYNDIDTLGSVQASKTVTADSGGNFTFDTSSVTTSIGWNTGSKLSYIQGATNGDILLYDQTNLRAIWTYDESANALVVASAITASAGVTGNVTGNVTAGTHTLTSSGLNLGNENLANYDEGTWTPTIQDSSLSDAEGQTYTTQDGKYTRIGNVVYVSFNIVTTSLGTLTGGDPAYIAGLPFTATTGYPGGIVLSSSSSMAITATTSVTGTVVASSTRLSLQSWDSANGTSLTTITEVSDTTNITGHGFYFV